MEVKTVCRVLADGCGLGPCGIAAALRLRHGRNGRFRDLALGVTTVNRFTVERDEGVVMSGARMLTSPAEVSQGQIGDTVGTLGRDMGIPALGVAPWGTHFCEFYDSKQDLLDILVPYFRAGLENNEACVWVTAGPVSADDAAEALSQEMDDFESRLAAGQIELVPHSTWYLPDGKFDGKRVLAGWNRKLVGALAQGYDGLRATGNLHWLDESNWSDFAAYEGVLESRIGDQRMLVVCTYSLGMCGATEMVDVLLNHQFALIRRDDWTLIEPSESKKATAAVERMNTALAERTADLQAALADLYGFCRWVSHDLRTPLRAITSFGDMLSQRCEGRLDGRERHMLERIRENSTRMDRLITDILAYSTAQQSTLQTRILDMEMLVRDVAEPLADTVIGRRVELQVDPLPEVRGDPAMISQVLANLLGNSVKFTRNRPVARIKVGAITEEADPVFYVRDNGIGFEQGQAEKLFGAFERLQGTGEFEGTGLGLAIVRQIIQRHGGRIWAEGVPGSGATFYFTLPGV